MINIHDIVEALKNQLNADADVSNILEVGANEYVNEDFNRAPWACVYKGKVGYETRTLGYNNWEATPTLKVLVQASSVKSTFECQERLEDLVKKIISATIADKTLSNSVEMLNKFDVEYGFKETERSTMFFQTAVINFEFEVATQ